MFPSSFSSSTTQELVHIYQTRKLLLHSPLYYHTPPSSTATQPSSVATTTQTDASLDTYTTPNNGFDANVIMVLSVLLCALFCSLGLNSIIRCSLNCSNLIRNRNFSDGENRRINSVTLANKGGVRKKALKTFPTVSYSSDLKLPGLDSECVICLSEFVAGERVRLLPKCNHGFHVRCIDKWLGSNSSCPTCRSCLVDTCQKIVGCNEVITSLQSTISSSELPVPLPVQVQTHEIIVNVTPLEREDMIRSYRSNES